MNKIICTLCALLVSQVIFCQNYNAMWSEVEKAHNNDLPKTAIATLDKIINTANRKGDNDQLAKALIEKMYAAEVIAPDSAEAFLPKVEQFCYSRKKDDDRAVYQVLLGWLYACRDVNADPQTQSKAIETFRKATANPAVLANARSDKYLTILNKGDDSRYYNHDLLSVFFPFVASQLKAMKMAKADSLARQVMAQEIDWYSARQMREATMLAKIDSAAVFLQDNIDFYKQIIQDYGDLPVSTKAYAQLCMQYNGKEAYELANKALHRHPNTAYTNTFKNIIAGIKQATLRLNSTSGSTYPGDTLKLAYSYSNVSDVTLSYYRLPYSATSPEWLNIKEKDFPSLAKNAVFRQQLPLRKGMPYDEFTDSIAISMPHTGLYLVEISGSNFKSRYSVISVSRLAVMQLPLPDEQVRVGIVDYKSGKPIANSIVQLRIVKNNSVSWKKYTTNENGEITFDKIAGSVSIFASKDNDNALGAVALERSYAYTWNRNTQSINTQIYTDRAVYRPGQQVKMGGFIYQKENDSVKVIAEKSIDLEIRDANDKTLQTITVITDNLGAFETDFTLPQECLNGTFSIRNEYGVANFTVEEYKRPKFKIILNKPNVSYSLGDTIMVSGEVKTYSGLPMYNVTLICSTERKQNRWMRYNIDYEPPYVHNDTIKTDTEGRFTLPVILSKPRNYNDSISLLKPLNYIYTVNVKTTADDGETEENSLHLYAGNTKAFVNIDLPSVICKEQMPNLNAIQTNSMGEPVGGEGNYFLVQDTDTIQRGTIQFNQANQLDFIAQLPSGQYNLIVFPTNDDNKYHASSNQFIVFSKTDTKPTGVQPLQVWHNSNHFSYDKPVDILVGTPLKETWLHYDIIANGKIIESQICCLSDTVIRMQLDWKEEYGNGIHVLLTMYNKGELSSNSIVITKPLPDKNLQLRWTSFRDKLQPGTTESWTLQVLKNGKPVEASLVTTMYDASLDKFRKHSLPFYLTFNRYVPQQIWNTNYRNNLYLNIRSTCKPLAEKHFVFTTLNNLFNRNPFKYSIYLTGGGNHIMTDVVQARQMPMKAMAKSVNSEIATANDAQIVEGAEEELLNEEDSFNTDINLRSDFSETAFFTSTLRTDANGQATIEFKLPESLTSWNFKALAHTNDLCYGHLDTLIMVEKPFMVQSNMPRFLRNGDKTNLVMTIRNNSAKTQNGKAQLAIIDAQNGQQLQHINLPFCVEAEQSTTLEFPIVANDEQTMLICRYYAISDEFSDGEQQYLPIITDLQKTTNSLSFIINDNKTQTIILDSLRYNPNARHSQLIIEFTGNPAWSSISALPTTVDYHTQNATQLATNYSALILMQQIITNNPQLGKAIDNWKQTDSVPNIFALLQNNPELKIAALEQTPWVRSAEREQNRLEALAQDKQTLSLKQVSMLHKLHEMQTEEGGWQWFPGMPTNMGITLDIAEMLSRTRKLCPSVATDIDPILTSAMRYLDKQADSAVEKMMKNKISNISTQWIHYLYIVAITDGQLNTATRKFLINNLQKNSKNYNLYDKAMAAVIFHKAKQTQQAELTLNSLLEHTVIRSEMGRYFDSNRVNNTLSMYKIPTQVATIEAVQLIRPQDKQTLEEMRLWLIHCKHSQAWDEPFAATLATNCLLGTNTLAAPTAVPAKFYITFADNTTLPIQQYANIDPFVQLGYIKAVLGEQDIPATPTNITVKQSAATIEQPTSYGAAYLQSWQSALETSATSTELSIVWELYKETSNGLQKVGNDETIHIGDRIMVRYDITAARDFDFVVLRDGRPACLEPISSASGYNWNNGSYRSVEDTSTSWYFDSFSKGHHVIEEVYNVDRVGYFSSACPQIQCLYAPEFTARAKAITINVK